MSKCLDLGPVQTSNSHAPKLMRELNACEVRRLNQLNPTVYMSIKCDFRRICNWNSRRFDLGSTFDSNVAFHMCLVLETGNTDSE